MYVAAQRVISPSGQRGVNVYMYLHGFAWNGPPAPAFLPNYNPGVLVWQDIQRSPPGNHIISYLDVVASDDMPRVTLATYLGALRYSMLEQGNPTVITWGPLWCRFGLGNVPIPWSVELGALAAHLVLRLPPEA
jgi:hypothetical protein